VGVDGVVVVAGVGRVDGDQGQVAEVSRSPSTGGLAGAGLGLGFRAEALE
jgi:hypothetical protein